MIILLHRGIKKQPAMKVNKDALLEYECLKPNDLFIYQNKKKNYFRQYLNNSCSYCEIDFKTCQWYCNDEMNNEIIGFKETNQSVRFYIEFGDN